MKGKIKRFAVVLLTVAMTSNFAGMVTFADAIRIATPSVADKVVPGEDGELEDDRNKALNVKRKAAYINKTTPSNTAFTKVGMPSEDPDNPWGVISYNEPTGNGDWYTAQQLVITIKNAESASINTVYEMRNTAAGDLLNQDSVEQNENVTTIDFSKLVSDETEGPWELEVWNEFKSSSGASVRSEKYVKEFKVDSVAPTVNPTAKEVKAVNDSGLAKLINILTFGVFFNEALEVKVEVTDNTQFGGRFFDGSSHGDRLYYSIPTENGEQKGSDKIELDTGDHQHGFATFTIPVGTKGEVTMYATDGAGNSSKSTPVTLSVEKDGSSVTYWELENIVPEITGTTPADSLEHVNLSTDSIQLTFSEKVTPVPGKTVSIFAGREPYVYSLTETDKEQISGTTEAEFPLAGFKNPDTGEALALKGETIYTIDVEAGAFIDVATNQVTGGTVSMFTTGDFASLIKQPVIGSVDKDFPEGIRMLPEFTGDNHNYVLIVTDKALDETRSHLSGNLVLEVLCKGDARVSEAVLKDFDNNIIDDSLTTGAIEDEKARITVDSTLIESKENYILEVTVSNYGVEETYTFVISTSAITADVVHTTDGTPRVTLDTDALLNALQENDLADLVAKALKVSIRMQVSDLSVSAVQKELAAMQALRDAKGEKTSVAFYPMDFTIYKDVSDGTAEEITELGTPIQITMELPERIDTNEVEGFYRYHKDQAFEVPFKVDEESGTITFEADQFSIYAIAYPYTESDGDGGNNGGNNGGGSSGGGDTSGNTTASANGTWFNNGWVFVKANGQKAASEWLDVNGKIYRFSANGFLDKTYKGLNYAADGSLVNPEDVDGPVTNAAGVWLKDGWWYRTADGKALKGGWHYLFYQGQFDWYYSMLMAGC